MSEATLEEKFLTSVFGKAVGEDVCAEILRRADKQTWPANSMVFQEGDAAVGMFFVARGLIKLARITPDGRESVLSFVEPPGLFAEAAIFLGKYPATAIALADTELLLLRRRDVMELIGKHEPFLNFLFGAMAKWLQRLVSRIDQLTLSDGTARVARYLLAELDKQKPTLDFKVPRVNLASKKGDLATLLNMNQPSLSRIFRRLQDEKVIDVQGRTIYLNDLGALNKLTLPPLE
ncbi:MAG TPA: Crp/Fnr family transcriptional regulator [bacterium]|jgi:CRP-like cAMP-binding protein